jgi:hypothetical protein
MYPAKNGDAFLLKANKENILIDGGYMKTFDNYILSDLQELNTKGECLDLVITTHIDADHIRGVIKLLSKNGSSSEPKIIPIQHIWHNSLRALTSPYSSTPQTEDIELLEAINRRGHPQEDIKDSSSVKEISAKEGSTLASLIHSGGYLWNGGDGTKSISIDNTKSLPLHDGSISVLTPSQKRLDGLLKSWKKELQRYGYKGAIGSGEIIEDAFEFSFEHQQKQAKSAPTLLSSGRQKKLSDIYEPDTLIANGSSIGTIIELGGVRILMLADAWAEDVLESLQKYQLMGHSMIFDAIKISHHGSLHNTSPELLQVIDAPIYFISSNGSRYDHPDIEVLIEIIDRPANFSRTLLFNYSTPASKEIRNYKTKTGAPFSIIENATDWIKIGEG